MGSTSVLGSGCMQRHAGVALVPNASVCRVLLGPGLLLDAQVEAVRGQKCFYQLCTFPSIRTLLRLRMPWSWLSPIIAICSMWGCR